MDFLTLRVPCGLFAMSGKDETHVAFSTRFNASHKVSLASREVKSSLFWFAGTFAGNVKLDLNPMGMLPITSSTEPRAPAFSA